MNNVVGCWLKEKLIDKIQSAQDLERLTGFYLTVSYILVAQGNKYNNNDMSLISFE